MSSQSGTTGHGGHLPAEPEVPNRGKVIGAGGSWLARWSLRIVLVAAATWVLGWVIAQLWVAILPVLLAIIVSTVLWPPTSWLMRKGLPPAAAAGVTLLAFLAVLAGLIALIAPPVVDQSGELADKATGGIQRVQTWLQGPPVNLESEQIDSFIDAIVTKVQASSASIATGVFSGVSAAGSALVTLGLVLVLCFFFIKDGPRFVPWMHRSIGNPAGRHLEEVLRRMWATLGGFIRTQALVSLVDAVFIGAGLLILGVPLAPALALLTFIGGFVPIIGAFVAGALAVLVALVANSFTTALIVLALIIVVQQIEGNVLQPVLQSRSMRLHAVVVLLAVTAGGSIFGIVGAFLAVPAAAVIAVAVRYLGEQIDAASGASGASGAAPTESDGTADQVPDNKMPTETADDNSAAQEA